MKPDETSLRSAAELVERCAQQRIMVATAESCTGGMIAAAITDIAGSSAVLDRGLVTYSNEAKMEMLGVPAEIIDRHGAVSEETARAMVEGALRHSRAQLAVAVTGIAGPGGGSSDKPVGLVHLAAGRRGGAISTRRVVFAGDRQAVRIATVESALQMLLEAIPFEGDRRRH